MAIKHLIDGGYTTTLEPLKEGEGKQIQQTCELLAQALEAETSYGISKAVYLVSEAVHPWQVRCAQGSYGQNIPSVPYLAAIKEHCKTGIRAEKLSWPRPQWAARIRTWAAEI